MNTNPHAPVTEDAPPYIYEDRIALALVKSESIEDLQQILAIETEAERHYELREAARGILDEGILGSRIASTKSIEAFLEDAATRALQGVRWAEVEVELRSRVIPMPIPVSREVYEGIEAVRLSGATNMLDRPRVIEIAESWALTEAAAWIREHPDLYARAIFHGLEA